MILNATKIMEKNSMNKKNHFNELDEFNFKYIFLCVLCNISIFVVFVLQTHNLSEVNMSIQNTKIL